MVSVTKYEKEAVEKLCPKAVFHRTMKSKSKRHRYYMETTRAAMNALNKCRRKQAVRA